MTDRIEPRVSVVLVMRHWSRIFERVLDRVRHQSIAPDIELLLMVGKEAELRGAAEDAGSLGSLRIIELGRIENEGMAKAAGARLAQAPLVAFLEDHTFPDRRWAEALANRHERGKFACVGPVIRNANPRTAASWGCFLVYYGKDAAAVPESDLVSLPANHSCYRLDALLEYDGRLEEMLEAEWVLQSKLREKGLRLFLEPEAVSYHLNYAALSACVGEYFIGSRIFAAERAVGWGFLKRMLYAGGSPLLPVLRTPRIVASGRRAGISGGTIARGLLPVVAILAAGAAGELFGYAAGAGNSRGALIEFVADSNRIFVAGELEEAQSAFEREIRT